MGIPTNSYRFRDGSQEFDPGRPQWQSEAIPSGDNGIIGNSQALQDVLAQAEVVAPTDSTVIIYGKPVPVRNRSPA